MADPSSNDASNSFGGVPPAPNPNDPNWKWDFNWLNPHGEFMLNIPNMMPGPLSPQSINGSPLLYTDPQGYFAMRDAAKGLAGFGNDMTSEVGPPADGWARPLGDPSSISGDSLTDPKEEIGKTGEVGQAVTNTALANAVRQYYSPDDSSASFNFGGQSMQDLQNRRSASEELRSAPPELNPPATSGAPKVIDDPNMVASHAARLGLNFFPSTEGKIEWLSHEMGLPIKNFGSDENDNIYYYDPASAQNYYAVSPWVGREKEAENLKQDVNRIFEPGANAITQLKNLGLDTFDTFWRGNDQLWSGGVGAAVPRVLGRAIGLDAGLWAPAAIPAVITSLDAGRQAIGNWLLSDPLSQIDWWNGIGQSLEGLADAAGDLGKR